MRKIYKLLPNAKQGLFALALILFLGKAYSQTTYTFNYTGGAQTLAVQPGNYEIECWGANGGDGGGTTVLVGSGGKGGYSKGTYSVASTTTLYIYVGGVGQSSSLSSVATSISAPGGWNGGGGGFTGSTSTSALFKGGGGGGSDVRTTLNTTYSNRIIVAGGGGGGGGATSAGYTGLGGNGGGSSGQDGVLGTSQTTHNGKGGLQGAGGAGGIYATTSVGQAGSFGVGGNGGSISGNFFPAGGGGGGWYGGGGGATQGGSGGGGSGYIGGVTSGTTAQTGQPGFVTKPISTGDGLVIIKELCNITLSVTGTNNNGAICTGNSVTLTTNAVSNYSWSTGASSSSVIVASPTVTTTYSIGGTSSLNCTAYAAITVTVDTTAPTLTVSNSANSGGICPFRTATLTASGATTYTWTGGTPVTNGVSFSPSTTSDYTVTGQNACGTGSAVTSISIHPLPIINVSASSPSLCSGLSLTLTSTGNYTNHTWAGGYTSGVGFFPTLTNTYVATGTSSLSCTNTAAVIVTVVTTPALAPTYPSLICFGQTATLTASGATNYTWLPVAGSASAAPSVTVSPAVTTTYTVIKANANCVDTKTFVLNVNALPGVFAIVTPTVICALKTATLFGGGALTFTWTSTSFTTNGNSPVVAPVIPTTYTVVGSDGICTNTTTVSLAVDPNPTLSAAANPSVICLGQTTTLTALGGVNYTWSATTSTAYTATHTDNPTQPTLYTLTGDNSFGCTSSVNQIVLVNQLPPIAVVANKTLVCIGGDAKLTAAGANSYQWDPGAGSAITPTVNVNPMVTTSYTVEGTNSSTGCKNQKSVTITVFEPSVAVSSPTSTCYGGNINIVASGATSYTWHLGNGVTHPFATVLVTPTVFTIYTVTALTSTTGGLSCPSTNTTSIDIFYNPTITALPQRPTICRFESVQLYGSGGVFYTWTDPQSQTGATITVSPQLQTTYTVTGTDPNGCVSTGTVLVKVSPCVGIGEFNGSGSKITVYPNPNNGEFVIQSDITITLTLSNDLGQVIRTIDISEPSTRIEMNDLAKGVYFISGQKGAVKVYEKMIVIK